MFFSSYSSKYPGPDSLGKIVNNIPSLNEKTGSIISIATPLSNKLTPLASYPNWWVDDPSSGVKEGDHIGAKTINRWREDFLSDFAERMKPCACFAESSP